jgi:hypothetical protein
MARVAEPESPVRDEAAKAEGSATPPRGRPRTPKERGVLPRKPVMIFAGLLALGVISSLALSIVSLTVALQTTSQALPRLSYDLPATTVVRRTQCTDAGQNNALMTEYDVEYVLTISNSGGRAINLIHANLLSGAQNELPWPTALTNSPTNYGTAIDSGAATFALTPVSITAGQSRKIAINGRLRMNQTTDSQGSSAAEVNAGGKLRFTLAFSDGTKKIVNVPYTVEDTSATAQSATCAHTGDFHYHNDQE